MKEFGLRHTCSIFFLYDSYVGVNWEGGNQSPILYPDETADNYSVRPIFNRFIFSLA